jgi:outer membrane protein assembly factor BamB
MNAKQSVRFHRLLLVWLAFSVLAFGHRPPVQAQTFIPLGAVWKFLDNGQDQGTAWRAVNFDDSTWASGPAQLGFGDGDEATIAGAATRPVTVYFRHQFNVAHVVAGGTLTLRLLRDDGAVVYVNGTEVFRSNLPDGPVAYNTLATAAVGGPEETSVFVSTTLHPAVLVPGVNAVAVEVHQVNVTSSDLSFDLELGQDFVGTNQPIVTVVATDATAAEARTFIDEFPNPGVFRFMRAGPTNDALTVAYRLSGTASNGVDYTMLPGSVLIPAGAPSADVVVNVRDDGEVEGNETVHLALAPSPCIDVIVPGCYSIGTGSVATVTILDNERPVNSPPTAQLVTPANGTVFTGPTNILLVANASDADGAMTVQTVEFFEGVRSLGITTNRPVLNPLGPYVLIWNDVPPGQYILRVVATDDQDARGTSAPVQITVTSPPGDDVLLVQTGSVWKYLDTGIDQGTAWREPDFDDSAWAAGPAQLGYGDGDEATVVSFGPDPSNKYVTTYFRRTFEAADADAFESLTLRVLRDDGVVVHLNGVEVFRDNMPAGPVAFNTLALAVATDENEYLTATIPPSALVNGHNIVAVEIHQVNPSSSDLGFDLELIGHRGPRPPERTIINVVATDPDAAEAGLLPVVHSGTFTFYRSGNLQIPLTAFFSVGGSASNGIDYVRVTNRVSFAAGAVEARLNINPIYDTLPEGAETVVLTLEPPVCIAIFPPPPECYLVGPSNRATVYIADFPPSPTNGPPGTKLWEFSTGTVYASPAVAADGTVYIVAGNPDSTLYALQPNGVPKWETLLGRSGSSPAIGADGTIYVGANRSFKAYNRDGGLLWSYSFPATTLFYFVSAPAIAMDGTIYVGTGAPDKGLYAFRPDGTLKWKFTAGGAYADVYTPVIGVDGTIYFGAYNDRFYAINPNGTKRWDFPMAGYNISAAVGGEGTIYVIGSGAPNKLYAFTPSGVKRWERQIGLQYSQGSSAPAIGADGTIYVGCGHDMKLYAFNPDGSDKWTFAAGGNVGGTSASPAVDAVGNVYTGFGVSFFAISSSGSRLWSFQHNGVFTAPSLTADGILYVGSAADKVYAFQANAGLAQSPWPMFQRDLRHTGAAPFVPFTNQPPTVAIVAPTNGAVYQAPTAVSIRAVTQDPDGYADTVEFFANGVKIGESRVVFIQPPPPGQPIQFEFNWFNGTNAPVGEHRLTARTRDDRGATGTSAPVNIAIRSSPLGDSDGDGVADSRDRCSQTPPGTAVNSDGCSIAQLCPCDGPWRNHADYVSCVIEEAWKFYRQGLITESNRRQIIGEAARSNCGGHEGAHLHLQPQTREEIQQAGRCLIVCSEAAGVCVLEFSTDLLHWTPIQTVTLPSAEMEMVDTDAGGFVERFYRIRVAP